MKYYIKPAIKGLCVSKEFCVNIPISDTTTPEESESNTGFFEEESSNSVRKVGPWGEE
jgi:hypothetical protein